MSDCCATKPVVPASSLAGGRAEFLVLLGFSDALGGAPLNGARTAVFSPHFSVRDILQIDYPVQVDFSDESAVREKLIKLSEHHQVRAVLAFDDSWVRLAAQAETWLGLKDASSAEAVLRCLNKYELRKALAEHPLLAVPHRHIETVDVLSDAIEEIGLPCVVKPVDSSNSRMVHFCDAKSAAVAAALRVLEWSAQNSGTPRALIEAYLEGPEFSVESYTRGGETTVMAVCEKVLGPLPYFVEIGHYLPTRQPGEVEQSIAQAAKTALSVLGIDNLVTHTEVRLTAAGPKVIEINPRPAGGRLREFIQILTGYDLHEVLIQVGLGQEPRRQQAKASHGIYHCLTAGAEGIVMYDRRYLRQPLALGFYPLVELNVHPQEMVYPVNHKEGRVLGRILSYGRSLEAAQEEVGKILRQLQFRILPANGHEGAQAPSGCPPEAGGKEASTMSVTTQAGANGWNARPNGFPLPGQTQGPGFPGGMSPAGSWVIPAWFPGIGWMWLVAYPAGPYPVGLPGAAGAACYPAPAETESRADASATPEISLQTHQCQAPAAEPSTARSGSLAEESGAWNRGCC